MQLDRTKLSIPAEAQRPVFEMLEANFKTLSRKQGEVVRTELPMPDGDGPLHVSLVNVLPDAIAVDKTLVVGDHVYGVYPDNDEGERLWVQPKMGAAPETLDYQVGNLENVKSSRVYLVGGLRHVDLVRKVA